LNHLNDNVVIKVTGAQISSTYNSGVIQIYDDKSDNKEVIIKSHLTELNNNQSILFQTSNKLNQVILCYPTQAVEEPHTQIQILGESDIGVENCIHMNK
jgi:hypothetical protein